MDNTKGVLALIGRLLQREEIENKKRKQKKREARLQSKLADPQSRLNKREQTLLDTLLKRDEIVGRTDEGSLMDIRSDYGERI